MNNTQSLKDKAIEEKIRKILETIKITIVINAIPGKSETEIDGECIAKLSQLVDRIVRETKREIYNELWDASVGSHEDNNTAVLALLEKLKELKNSL